MEEQDKNIFEIFGNNLKRIRLKKGITIEELAQRTKIRKEYIKQIEKGNCRGINVCRIFCLNEGLNTNLKDLLKDL